MTRPPPTSTRTATLFPYPTLFRSRSGLDAAEGKDFRDPARFDLLAVLAQHLYGLVRLDRARRDAAGNDAAEEVVRFEDRADHPERTFLDDRLGHVLEHQDRKSTRLNSSH